jgi:GyrI-like small molecule binding protein
VEERAGLVSEHLQRLEDQLARTRAAVASLQRLRKPTAGLSPEVRSEPATPVAAIEGTVGEAEILSWYAGAMAELDAAVPAATGAPGGLYDNELFTEGRGRALVYRPAPAPIPAIGRVHQATLPAVELAVVVHPGDHDTINVTYAELGQWVATHALAVAGPVRERYLCGPRDTPDAAWRTEIGWPVFRLAGSAWRAQSARLRPVSARAGAGVSPTESRCQPDREPVSARAGAGVSPSGSRCQPDRGDVRFCGWGRSTGVHPESASGPPAGSEIRRPRAAGPRPPG